MAFNRAQYGDMIPHAPQPTVNRNFASAVDEEELIGARESQPPTGQTHFFESPQHYRGHYAEHPLSKVGNSQGYHVSRGNPPAFLNANVTYAGEVIHTNPSNDHAQHDGLWLSPAYGGGMTERDFSGIHDRGYPQHDQIRSDTLESTTSASSTLPEEHSSEDIATYQIKHSSMLSPPGGNIAKDAGSDKYQAAYLAAIGKRDTPIKSSPSESPPDTRGHSNGCSGTRAHSTPPASPPYGKRAKLPSNPVTSRTYAGTLVSNFSMFPDPEKDLSRALKEYRKFHDQAQQVLPRISLASHRYWVAVLELGKNPATATAEKHFTWMKGNRFTTVETIWRTYSTSTASVDFVLLLGADKVEWTERMEELDYFNSKLIVLRCVYKKSQEAKGLPMSDGLIPPERKMIELIDDD